ncbi:MAG: exosome complex protein Rrp42 [Candidatus Micrarchaeia archaeon]
MEILDELKKDYMRDLAKAGKRADDRAFDAFRQITVEKGVLTSTEGSARVKWGKTQVLAGIKFDVATPFKDRPDEGVLSTNSELLPLASPTFEPGPPDERSIELARVVDRGIRSANVVDLKSFYLDEGKVLALYIDLYVLDHDGNFIDASALAAMAALANTKFPKVEAGEIIRGEYAGELKLGNKVVATTFAKIGNALLLDPSLDEETAMDGRITIATTEKSVCAIQKGGMGGFTRPELDRLFDLALAKGHELRALV